MIRPPPPPSLGKHAADQFKIFHSITLLYITDSVFNIQDLFIMILFIYPII